MFAKLSVLVLVLPPVVSALTIAPLTGAITGQPVTITWASSTADPSYFSIELEDPSLNDVYAIASNVQTSLGEITITLPQVPSDNNFILVAVNPGNAINVLSISSIFSIGAATTTSSASSTTSSVSPTASVAGSSGTSNSSSNGAAPFKMPGIVSIAGILLSAVAGAAMVF